MSQTRLNALACIDRLIDSLDKMMILDEVLPFLTEISCQDVDIIMSVICTYLCHVCMLMCLRACVHYECACVRACMHACVYLFVNAFMTFMSVCSHCLIEQVCQ